MAKVVEIWKVEQIIPAKIHPMYKAVQLLHFFEILAAFIYGLTLKDSHKVKSDHTRRFPAHDF